MSVRGNNVQQPGAIEGGQFLPKNVEIPLTDLEWIENRLRLRYDALNDHAARRRADRTRARQLPGRGQ